MDFGAPLFTKHNYVENLNKVSNSHYLILKFKTELKKAPFPPPPTPKKSCFYYSLSQQLIDFISQDPLLPLHHIYFLHSYK